MRDIDRGDDAKPGAHDVGGVLPPLPGTVRRRVRELVHQHHLSAARDRRRGIEIGEHGTAVGDRPWRDHLQAAQLAAGLRAAMGFDPADHHTLAVPGPVPALGQHGKGLADPGRSSQVGAQ